MHLFIDQSSLKVGIRVWNQPLKIDRLFTQQKTPFTLINIPFYQVWNIRNILKMVADKL